MKTPVNQMLDFIAQRDQRRLHYIAGNGIDELQYIGLVPGKTALQDTRKRFEEWKKE